MPDIDLIRDCIPQLRLPRPQLVTGGQPETTAWPRLARAGISTVINLRPEVETPGRDEAGEVRAAGMAYVHVPVDGPDALGPAQASALRLALEQASGPVLVHCGSGNRCGALLALVEAWEQGRPVEDAIAFGRQAGLTALEPVVRAKLT